MFSPLEKVVIIRNFERKNARIIGIKKQANGSVNYLIELVRKDFAQHQNGAKIIRVSASDLEEKRIIIEKHI